MVERSDVGGAEAVRNRQTGISAAPDPSSPQAVHVALYLDVRPNPENELYHSRLEEHGYLAEPCHWWRELGRLG